MATITTALNTAFTSSASTFCVQVTGGGSIRLERRATSSDPWADAGTINSGQAVDVVNTVTSQEWRMVPSTAEPAVIAYA